MKKQFEKLLNGLPLTKDVKKELIAELNNALKGDDTPRIKGIYIADDDGIPVKKDVGIYNIEVQDYETRIEIDFVGNDYPSSDTNELVFSFERGTNKLVISKSTGNLAIIPVIENYATKSVTVIDGNNKYIFTNSRTK